MAETTSTTNNQIDSKRNPWAWIPSLYFAEGIPYIIVMTVTTLMYPDLGISNSDMAFYTGWLYLPWVFKFIWSPFVDILKTKRFWIIIMQVVIGAGFAGIALTLSADNFFRYSLAFFWLIAFSSATHDIAADGLYMIALRDDQQAFFVGIRSTFYRIAVITGQGLLVILAGQLEDKFDVTTAWQITMGITGLIMIVLYLYHTFSLPKVEKSQEEVPSFSDILNESFAIIRKFFQKKQIWLIIGFILVYRLGEAQLATLANPFLQANLEEGGLGLEKEEIGFIYGTLGVLALVIGGILGGILASRHGLKHWLWWMVAAINIPNAVYIYLSITQPESLWVIGSCVVIEQFGYGFGFTAFMLYLIYVADGEHKTAHFAFCTGLMALGMAIPRMLSGTIQESIGYQNFFIWVLIATIPAFILTYFIPLDPEFGKKSDS